VENIPYKVEKLGY